MREAALIGVASLEPNMSSDLADVRQRILSDTDLASIRTILCGSAGVPAPASTPMGLSALLEAASGTQAELGAEAEARPLSKLLMNNLLEPMQRIDQYIDHYTSDFWTQSGDERTSKLPFMSAGPWKLLYATIVYLYLIKWLLPRLMRNSKAFELNWCIRAYNLLMVLSNMYAFYHGARILGWGLKCFGCEVINHQDNSPQTMELLHYGWLFFLSRLVEWLDTIFFVLRKKERQVTKLHVFHHSFVPVISWVYLKYHPGYTVAFFPFVNSFVHSIMYTYYLLATFGPAIQPYLWWKKYLTSLQISQFVLILIQLSSIPLSTNERCQYPRGFLYVALAGALLFLWLFYTYYLDTYGPKSSDKCGTKLGCQHELRRKWVREGNSTALADTIEDAMGPHESETLKRPKSD